MAVVDELVTILGIDLKQDVIGKLNGFKEKLGEVTKSAAKLGAVITAAATGAALYIRNTINEANELHKLSEKTGISTDALQEWKYAAEKAGLEAKAITSDLANLQKTMASPIPGEFNATLAMFGVRVRNAGGELKTTDQLLLDMSVKFEKMSEQKAAQWASKLGISDDTLLLLRRGKEGIEALRKEAHKLGGIIPEKSIRAAVEFRRQLSELQFAIKGLGHQAAIAAIPALDKLVGRMKKFIESNREWISLGLQSFMDGLSGGVERVWKMLGKLGDKFKPVVDAVKKFLPEMTGAELVTHLVTGALTLLIVALSPLLAKFALIAAKATLLSLLFEDFFTFLEGGESVTGDLFNAFKERWPELYGALEKAGKFIKENFIVAVEWAWEAIEEFGAIVADVVGYVLDKLNALVDPVSEFFATFEDEFPAVVELFRWLADFIGGAMVSAFGALKAAIKPVIDLFFEFYKMVGGAIKGALGGVEWAAKKLGFSGDKKPKVSRVPNQSYAEDDTSDSPDASQGWIGRAREASRINTSSWGRPSRGDKEKQGGVEQMRDAFRINTSSWGRPRGNSEKKQDTGGAQKGTQLEPIFSKQMLDVSLFQKQQIPSNSRKITINNSDNRNITINIATNDPVNAGRQVNNAVSSSPLNTNTPGQFSPTVH